MYIHTGTPLDEFKVKENIKLLDKNPFYEQTLIYLAKTPLFLGCGHKFHLLTPSHKI